MTERVGTGTKPIMPDRQHSSNRVIQMQTEMKFEAKERRERKKKKGKKGKGEENQDKSNYTTDIHLMDNATICSTYKTDLANGLTNALFEELQKQYGPNELTPPPTLAWYLKLLLSIFGGFFNQLLWAGSILCFVAYGVARPDERDPTYMYLGVVLAVVVSMTGTFGYYQEAKSDDIMEGFKSLAPEDVTVFRDGRAQVIEPRDLVPGDIIEIRYGMKLPADVRIMDCSRDMEVDNASLTGEAEPQGRKWVKADDPLMLPIEAKNLAFFGTNLLKGTGKAMIFKTGDNTLMGSIAAMAADTGAVETPIAKEIHDFVLKISAIAFALGITFFIVSVTAPDGDWLNAVILLIGIIVANVPEGLLATVTVSLTLTARRMAVKKVRVKNLESVETLGSTSVICSDKTGTLTTSIMTCADVVFDMQRKPTDTSDPEHATEGDFYDKETGGQLPSFKRLLRCGVLCNNSEVIINKKSGKRSYSSDPTEQAIFKFCLGNITQTLDTKTPVKATELREKHYPKLAEIPFNSKNKWQVSVHLANTDEACFEGEKRGDSIVEIKGAPERILNLCDSYCFEGKQYALDDEAKNQIRALNAELAGSGERVLGFADALCEGKAYPQDRKDAVFDKESMTVNGVAIPKSGGSPGSLIVQYEGEDIEIKWQSLKKADGESFESFGTCTIRSLLQSLSEQVSLPPAQMRLFNYKYSQDQNGEIDDDSMSFTDCQISENGDMFLLATGHYRFAGTSAKDANWPMTGFRFLGFYAMIDPPRPSVPDAVLKCQAAGIKVVMVTGDHPTTAEAIAKQVNIIPLYEADPNSTDEGKMRKVEIGRWTKAGQPPELPEDKDFAGVVVAGAKLKEELEKGMDDPDYEETFWNTVLSQRRYCVFARTSPRQKLLIVQACQQRGGIVAVTGDGVNDSPALKKADIGVAMGITGTEVAKDAADMILLDDNFASIVNGVEEGRIIFDNLKKSIAYTLSSNIPEIAPFLLHQTIGIPLPLTTVMILLVDLGTDLAPAISLAHEGKEADIMQRPPRDPERDNLVTWRLISFSYLQIGILQAIAGFYAYFCVLFEWGLEPKHIVGMDKHFVFAPPKIKKLFEFGYFLWCFTDSSMECVYTPKTFSCDMIGWKESAWKPFGEGDWYPTNFDELATNGITVTGDSGDIALKDCWTNQGICNTNPECLTFNKAMFSSMVCQWTNAIGDETRCGWTQQDLTAAVNTGVAQDSIPTFSDNTKPIMYKSKGTADGVYLDTSQRYSNRYCQPEDYHIVKEMSGGDNNWADGVETDGAKDDLAAVNTIMYKRFIQSESDRWGVNLCDAQGEKITNGGGHPASIFPYQMHDRVNALRNSNTAYFISIIIVQWGDLMICKTRSRSLFEQGMTNVFMNWSLMFETILGAFLCYVSVCNDAMQTLPIDFVWWTPAIPFSLAIYSYDELRKGVIRAYPDGWLRYNTYW
jgi:magnesium-transporting ATPase (P-type)